MAANYQVFISYGMTKAGSTLAFELMRESFLQAGHDQSRLPATVLDNASHINFLDDTRKFGAILAYLEATPSCLVLKTDKRPSPLIVQALREGRARGHAVYRDPRDMALSLLDAGHQARANGWQAFSEIVTLDDAIAAMRHQSKILREWLNLPGIAAVKYDDVAFRTEATVVAMQEHAGVEADRALVISEVFENRFTQFNKGVPARHRNEMRSADAARIKDQFKDLFDDLIEELDE